MSGKAINITPVTIHKYHIVLDTCDCFTCSFKEFLPFNAAMYYYSSFKAFGVVRPAWVNFPEPLIFHYSWCELFVNTIRNWFPTACLLMLLSLLLLRASLVWIPKKVSWAFISQWSFYRTESYVSGTRQMPPLKFEC